MQVICDNDISFVASPNQVVRTDASWCAVKDLKQGDRLWCYNDSDIVVQEIHPLNEELELIEISVRPSHTFFITSAGILVHNSQAIVISAAPVIVPVIAKAAGVVATIGSVLYSLFAKKAGYSISRNSVKNSSNYSTPSLPPEDPENEKSFYKKIKNRADKIVRTKRFGKLYRDPETKLWWSKNNAHHGVSRYKVLKKATVVLNGNLTGMAWGK